MHYNNHNALLRQRFGAEVRKVPIDGGFSCPNRDGRVGRGGCTFCRNEAFSPRYCREAGSIREQIEEGKRFFSRRQRKKTLYLAYFQAYSSTYAPTEKLRAMYEEALGEEDVVGMAVSTRPDCIDEGVLDLLSTLAERTYVSLELGIESTSDRTLREINRGHDYGCAVRAAERVAKRGIPLCGHFIIGLPGESQEEIVGRTEEINRLPLTSIKLHQLQLLSGTALEERCRKEEAYRQTMLRPKREEYVCLVCDILERLRADISIERLSAEVPERYISSVAERLQEGGEEKTRNSTVATLVEEELCRRGTRQGEYCERN